MLSYFYSNKFIEDEKKIVLKEIKNIELKNDDLEKVALDKIEHNPSLNEKIKTNKIIIKSLKYYYNL
jgi:hypothetical protein